jgi:hypothetical protein
LFIAAPEAASPPRAVPESLSRSCSAGPNQFFFILSRCCRTPYKSVKSVWVFGRTDFVVVSRSSRSVLSVTVFFSPAPALESSLDLFFVAVPARGPSAPDRVALLACPFPAEQVSSLPGARAQTSSSCFFLVLSLSDPFARVEFYLEILPP